MSHRYHFPSQPLANSEAIVGGSSLSYRFTVLDSGLIRYEWATDGVFEDRASTFALNRQLAVPTYRIVDDLDRLEIITDKIHLLYNKSKFTPSGLTANILGKFSRHGALWRYGEDCGDLGGTARTLDGVDGRISLGHGVISREGYATIDDSQSMLFSQDGWIATRRGGKDRIDGYLFGYGHDYRAAIKVLYAVSGSQPLLPRWALGNWWSRYYAYSAEEFLQLMDRFQAERLPFSVGVLDMDWHLVNDDKITGNGWTGYSWNPSLFPDPELFLDEMHKRDLRVTINDHPADGVRSFEDQYQAMAKALGRDSSTHDPIDFDITNREFCDAFFDVLHRHHENQGIDFWWIDWQQGPHSRMEGVDPLWVLNHYHYLDNGLGGKRPLTFSRFAGPGSHRYPIGFSGDTQLTWASLQFQPEFTATASNIGYGWWSHDIGGHYGGHKDEELSARWVQYGVFAPILRLHSTDNPFNTKEPWTFGVEAQGIMAEFLRMRHRLLPYIYTMNVRAARDMEPLVWPVYWDYPSVDAAYRSKNEFCFGTELLVVPITDPRDSQSRLGRARCWMPPGRHVDIFSGVVYDGDRELLIHRPLSAYPVFGREGAIVPLDAAAEPTNGAVNPVAFEIVIIVGADGSFDLVEDNGTGSLLDEIQFSQISIIYVQSTGAIKIRQGPSDPALTPKTREWKLKILACDIPKKGIRALLDGELHEILVGNDARSGSTIIDLGVVPSGSDITVEIGPNPQLTVTDSKKHLLPVLHGAYIDYELKRDIWMTLEADVQPGIKIGQLSALGLNDAVLSAFIEYLTADSRS